MCYPRNGRKGKGRYCALQVLYSQVRVCDMKMMKRNVLTKAVVIVVECAEPGGKGVQENTVLDPGNALVDNVGFVLSLYFVHSLFEHLP